MAKSNSLKIYTYNFTYINLCMSACTGGERTRVREKTRVRERMNERKNEEAYQQ